MLFFLFLFLSLIFCLANREVDLLLARSRTHQCSPVTNSRSLAQDLVTPVHGSSDPAPVAGSIVSGPGQFRNYAADAAYLETDPLRHGLDAKQVGRRLRLDGEQSSQLGQPAKF